MRWYEYGAGLPLILPAPGLNLLSQIVRFVSFQALQGGPSVLHAAGEVDWRKLLLAPSRQHAFFSEFQPQPQAAQTLPAQT